MKIYQCEFCHKQFNRLFFLDRHYNRKNKCITELFVLSQDQCNETRMVQFEPKPKPILSEQNEPKTNPLRTDLEPSVQNEPKTNPLRTNLEPKQNELKKNPLGKQNEPKTNPLGKQNELKKNPLGKQNEPKTNPIGKQNEPKTNPIVKQNEPKFNPLRNDLESPKPTKNELELIYSVDNHSNKRTKKYKTDELLKEKFLPYNKYTKKHLLALLNKTL